MGQLSEEWHKKGATWLALVDLQRADVLQQDQPGVVPAVLQLVFDEFQRWGAWTLAPGAAMRPLCPWHSCRGLDGILQRPEPRPAPKGQRLHLSTGQQRRADPRASASARRLSSNNKTLTGEELVALFNNVLAREDVTLADLTCAVWQMERYLQRGSITREELLTSIR